MSKVKSYKFYVKDPVELERFERILMAEGIKFDMDIVKEEGCVPLYTLSFTVEERRLPFNFCYFC